MGQQRSADALGAIGAEKPPESFLSLSVSLAAEKTQSSSAQTHSRPHKEIRQRKRKERALCPQANHGVAPNPHLPGTFLATAHDLADPWADGCFQDAKCCISTGAD